MEIKVDRVQKDPDVTIGKLSVDGVFECWTLEDPVRPDNVKIYGETAIGAGEYEVTITFSPRFRVMMPLLLNVKDFAGVRIHPGNSVQDTEGCLLVGMDRLARSLGRSRIAYDKLYTKIDQALKRKEKVVLKIA